MILLDSKETTLLHTLTKRYHMINDLLSTAAIVAIVPAIITVVSNIPWCVHCVH